MRWDQPMVEAAGELWHLPDMDCFNSSVVNLTTIQGVINK